jgi:hypothetical protein
MHSTSVDAPSYVVAGRRALKLVSTEKHVLNRRFVKLRNYVFNPRSKFN